MADRHSRSAHPAPARPKNPTDYAPRPKPTSHSRSPPSDDVRLTVSPTALSSSDDDGVPPSPPSDSFSFLYEAIDARLQLTSKCLLLLTKILKEMRKPPTHLTSPPPPSLLPSLQDALLDAQRTHSELLTLHQRFLPLLSDRSLPSAQRKRRKRRGQRLSQDVEDVSRRFSQVRQLALDKLKPPHQQTHEMESVLSPRSQLTPLLPGSADSAEGYEGEATYQGTESLQALSEDGQELFDAERDAAERATFLESIERDVSLVHSLFEDLHDLVSVQGNSVDRLEGAITRTHLSTRQAVDEIFKAERYARQRRQRTCCLWMTAAMLCIMLLLVLYILKPY